MALVYDAVCAALVAGHVALNIFRISSRRQNHVGRLFVTQSFHWAVDMVRTWSALVGMLTSTNLVAAMLGREQIMLPGLQAGQTEHRAMAPSHHGHDYRPSIFFAAAVATSLSNLTAIS